MEKISLSGEKVFIGIDVHKHQYVVNCRCKGEVVGKCSMPAYPRVLLEFIEKYFTGAEIHTAYEAGFSGFVLHRELAAAGIKDIVVHPLSIEVSPKKVKTDKRDSARIAEQLEAGRLKGNRVPSEKQELGRLLSRTRAQLVRARTRAGNQITMKLFQFGLVDPADRSRMRMAKLRLILSREMPQELKISLSALASMWQQAHSQIATLELEFKRQSREDSLQRLYTQIPGVGELTARVLADELGDMSQFRNEKQLFSFLGLVPSEHSSGEKSIQGHITRQGSSWLRAVLVEVAWMALKKDRELAIAFSRIAVRTGKRKAIVAIARKLAGKARAMVRKAQDYRMDSRAAA